MGRNKDLRARIAGQQRVIEKHENKIRQERLKPLADEGLISGWQREIEAAKTRIQHLTRRLKREW